MTRLSLEIEGKKVTWETLSDTPYCDDLLDAFIGLLVAHTFSENCVIGSMHDLIEERKPDGLGV
jgi:hypothetical protein